MVEGGTDFRLQLDINTRTMESHRHGWNHGPKQGKKKIICQRDSSGIQFLCERIVGSINVTGWRAGGIPNPLSAVQDCPLWQSASIGRPAHGLRLIWLCNPCGMAAAVYSRLASPRGRVDKFEMIRNAHFVQRRKTECDRNRPTLFPFPPQELVWRWSNPASNK